MASISLTRTTDGTTSNANSNLNNNWSALETAINGGLDATNLAVDSVGSSEIAAGAVGAAELAQMAATTNDALVWTGAAWVPTRIANAQIAAAAAIAVTKLANGTDGQVLKTVGTTPTWGSVSTLIQRNTTPVGTGASTALVDLQTVTITGATLATGDIVRISVGGTSSGTAANRTFRLLFGSAILTSDLIGAGVAGASWAASAAVVVTGAATQKTTSQQIIGSVAVSSAASANYLAATEAVSGSIVVKTQGQTSNAADEITSEMLTIEVMKA